jgi:hypothetical protein
VKQPDIEPKAFAAAIVEAIDGRRTKKVETEVTFDIKGALKILGLENLQA